MVDFTVWISHAGDDSKAAIKSPVVGVAQLVGDDDGEAAVTAIGRVRCPGLVAGGAYGSVDPVTETII